LTVLGSNLSFFVWFVFFLHPALMVFRGLALLFGKTGGGVLENGIVRKEKRI